MYFKQNKEFILLLGYYPPSETASYDESFPGERSDFFTNLCMDWEEAGRLPEDFKTRSVQVRLG